MFVPGQNQLLANLSLLLFLRIFRSFVFMILKRTFEECVSLFSYQRSFFALPFVSNSFAIISCCFLFVKKFFNFFEVIFNFSTHQRQLCYLITTHFILSRTFFISLFNHVCQLQLWYNSIYFCFRQLPFYIFLHFLLYASYIIFSVPENELHLWCSPPESGWFLFPVLHFSCMLPEGLLW